MHKIPHHFWKNWIYTNSVRITAEESLQPYWWCTSHPNTVKSMEGQKSKMMECLLIWLDSPLKFLFSWIPILQQCTQHQKLITGKNKSFAEWRAMHNVPVGSTVLSCKKFHSWENCGPCSSSEATPTFLSLLLFKKGHCHCKTIRPDTGDCSLIFRSNSKMGIN